MILADSHLHSAHSGDSEAPMESMILRGIELGLHNMCFTEHNDYDFPDAPDGTPGDIFLLDIAPYKKEFELMRERFEDRIGVGFGIELGLQPHLAGKNAALAKSEDFDFVIGSSHICDLADPYYPEFYEGRTEREAYERYFLSEVKNIRAFDDFDIYGHLDYVVRYGPNADRFYSYEAYKEVLDEVLRLLIEKGKGIELNTGGLKSGLRDLHPTLDILKRYKELGGEIVTVGSDAHSPERLAGHFDRAEEALRAAGFDYYTVFQKRQPKMIRL